MDHLSETQFNEYLDQVIGETSHQRVEAHLEACGKCRRKLGELEKVFSALASLPDELLAHDLTPNVLARLLEAKQPSSLWRQPAFVAQSLLAIFLLFLSIPILPGLMQQIAAWNWKAPLPQIRLFPLFGNFSELIPQFAWSPRFPTSLPEIPFSISQLPIELEANTVLGAAITAGLLWVIGNFSLLRNGLKARE